MASGANLEQMPSMEDVLEQTAAAILGLDPDYSTQQEIEDARQAALAKLPPDGDDVALQMIERAAALLLGGMNSDAVLDEAVVVDELVSIGPYSLSSNLERLQQLGVTAVLSVDAARPPLFELEMADIRVHHIKWADPLVPSGALALRGDLQGDLDEICDFVAAEAKAAVGQGVKPRVLFSCSRGDSRSYAAACAYLVRRHSWRVPQAIEHLTAQVHTKGNRLPTRLTLPEPLAEELRKFAHVVSGTKLKIGGRNVTGANHASSGVSPLVGSTQETQSELEVNPETEPQPEPDTGKDDFASVDGGGSGGVQPSAKEHAAQQAKAEREQRAERLTAAVLAEELAMEEEGEWVTVAGAATAVVASSADDGISGAAETPVAKSKKD